MTANYDPLGGIESAAYLQGYIEPAYWHDHAFNDGNAVAVPAAPSSARARARATRSLTRYLQHDRAMPPIALEEYPAGETVDTKEHPPGTLFWVYEEAVAAYDGITPYRLTDQPAVHTPEPWEGVKEVGGPNWSYVNRSGWWIAAEGAKGRRYTYALHYGAAAVNDGVVQIQTRSLTPRTGVTTVGEVEHTVGPFGKAKMLNVMSRTIRMYRCTNGDRPKRPRPGGGGDGIGALMRIALGHSRA